VDREAGAIVGDATAKVCRGCGERLLLDAFYPHKDGVSARCKACLRAARRAQLVAQHAPDYRPRRGFLKRVIRRFEALAAPLPPS
jgi:hypothetical protein